MVVVFYDTDKDVFHIYKNQKTVSSKDPNLFDCIPNDDVLYVSEGHFLTKQQLAEWMGVSLNPSNGITKTNKEQKFYIHPTNNGTIRIEDIVTPQFPEGIQLNGKWHFISVDSIGEELLLNSNHFKVLLAKNKIEIVPESYVSENKHKQKSEKSPYQAALDAILVPPEIKAERAASEGWSNQDRDITEILIED